MKPVTAIITLALGILAALLIYAWLREPEPLSERLEDASEQLQEGNPMGAFEELENRTYGEQAAENIEDVFTGEENIIPEDMDMTLPPGVAPSPTNP